MMFLSPNDLRRLGTELDVTNTGSFLYRRFAADPVVRALALRKSDDLLAAVRHADAKTPPSLDEEIEAYAAAVAMLVGGNAGQLEQYALARPAGLRWIPGILSAFRSSPQSSSVSVQQVSRNDYRISISRTPSLVSAVSNSQPKGVVNKPTPGLVVIDVNTAKKNPT